MSVHEDWGERDARWRGVHSTSLDVAGTATHLLRAEARRDGPTQLLVHGLAGSSTNWLEVMTGLAEHGPVVAPDLPGFGRTEPTRRGGSRLRATLVFLADLVRELDAGPVVLHGNSMGGVLATQLAARRPDLVARLVLVDPGFPWPRTALHQLGRRTWVTFAPFVIPRLSRRLIGRLHGSRTAQQLYDDNQALIHADPTRVRAPLKEVGRDNVAFAQRTPWRLTGLADAGESVVAAQLAQRGVWRDVARVEAPTLLAWGDHDRLVGRRVIDATLARRPDWELHVFEGVGHVAMVEVPDDYLDVVTRWYARSGEAAGPAATAGEQPASAAPGATREVVP